MSSCRFKRFSRNWGYRSTSRGRSGFPDLCAATQAKREQRVEIYRQELLAALTEELPPTVAQVALRLGISVPQLSSSPSLPRAL
jgi:hypothetical protein